MNRLKDLKNRPNNPGKKPGDLPVEEEYPIEELVIRPALFEEEEKITSFPKPVAPKPKPTPVKSTPSLKKSLKNKENKAKNRSEKKILTPVPILEKNEKIDNSLWLSISEAAKFGGIQTKTVRRGLKSNVIKYKIIRDRYLVEMESLLSFLHTTTKLKNKLDQFGLGQYVEKWKKALGFDKNK